MDNKEKIISMLDEHYPKRISFLPVVSPFRFLITVMLSASTTDRQAEHAAENLFLRFPSVEDIARAEVSEIEALIHSAGLAHSKAKNIKACAEYIEAHGIPETEEGLIALPGVGEKTAACYLVTILGKPGVIGDTHFVRVAERLGLTDTKDRTKAMKEIRERFDPSLWGRMSMTVNLHGRIVCKPRPLCSSCFLSSLCPSRNA